MKSIRQKAEEVERLRIIKARQYIIPDAKHSDDKTRIILHLPPYGLCFIIFNSRKRNLPEYKRSINGLTTEINSPWTVSFPKNLGAPASGKLDSEPLKGAQDQEGSLSQSIKLIYLNHKTLQLEVPLKK